MVRLLVVTAGGKMYDVFIIMPSWLVSRHVGIQPQTVALPTKHMPNITLDPGAGLGGLGGRGFSAPKQ